MGRVLTQTRLRAAPLNDYGRDMKIASLLASLIAGALCLPAVPAAAADWRPLDPENALVVDTTKGRIIVELIPEAAPAHVARMKTLAREKFYDGLIFHRVIDQFMAQTGDPLGNGTGGSSKPNLAPEFVFGRGPASPVVVVAQPLLTRGVWAGFIKSMPVMTEKDDMMIARASGTSETWGMFCPGVLGMARGSAPDSANSQFFLMRQISATLERQYTALGRVVIGLPVVRQLNVGEPPANPDKMLAVRVLADIPAAERPVVQVIDPHGDAFKALMKTAGVADAYERAACDIDLPVKVVDPKAP